VSAQAVPASIEQRQLWYLDHYRGADGLLNCPIIVELRGDLDPSALDAALARLVERHDTIRTIFSGRGRGLVQIVQPPGPVDVQTIDLRAEPDPAIAVRRAIAQEIRTRIDPTRCALRTTLWRTDDRRYVLCLNLHHLVADGWSCGLIVRDLRALYDRARGAPAALPDVQWPYARYVQWQQELLERDELRHHREYWREQLDGMRLPPLPIRPSEGDAAPRVIATHAVDIDPAVCDALRQIARARRTTMFTVMLSVYYVLLHGLTGERDLATVSLFANRLRHELQNTVGPFANMVILRTLLTKRPTFGDVLREAHATVAGAFLHQAVPFQMLPGLVEMTSYRADDVVFHMAADRLPDGRMGALELRAMQVEGVGNRFVLELAVLPRDTGLTAIVSYNETRVDREWAHALVTRYADLAARAARTPDAGLDALHDRASASPDSSNARAAAS